LSEKLKDHLTKQGVEVLRPLLGHSIVDLLMYVGQEVSTAEVMADLVISARGASVILRDASIRKLLIERLEEVDVRNLCSLLGISSSAPRTTLGGVDFDRPNAIATLFQWYGIPYVRDEDSDNDSTRRILSKEKLRKYQQPAYRQLRKILQNERRTILVHMPFGAGKLRTVSTAVLEALRSDPEDRTVFWIAPDTCLCEEALNELETVWDNLGCRDTTVYRLFGGKEDFSLDSIVGGLVVADIRTFLSEISSLIDRSGSGGVGIAKFGCHLSSLVFADAEHIVLPEMQSAIEKFRFQGSKANIIGICAATGPATDENIAMKIIADAYDEIVQINEDHVLTALQSYGGIDPVEVHLLPSPVTNLDYPEDPISIRQDILEGLACNTERNKYLLDSLLDISKSELRVVFYATTAFQARTFSELLKLKGVPSSTITSDMPRERQAQEIIRFENDINKQVLCVHDALISASAVNDVTAVVIAIPTISGALLHEMVGRMVTDRNKPQKPLKVFALSDPVPKYIRLVEELGRWVPLYP
jgi:hypothetical protein